MRKLKVLKLSNGGYQSFRDYENDYEQLIAFKSAGDKFEQSLGNVEALADEVEQSLNADKDSTANDIFHDATSAMNTPKRPLTQSTPTAAQPKRRPSLIPRPIKNTSANTSTRNASSDETVLKTNLLK